MKLRLLSASLVLCMAMSTDGYGQGLLDRMMSRCGSDCCSTSCCDATPSTCGGSCRRGLRNGGCGLFRGGGCGGCGIVDSCDSCGDPSCDGGCCGRRFRLRSCGLLGGRCGGCGGCEVETAEPACFDGCGCGDSSCGGCLRGVFRSSCGGEGCLTRLCDRTGSRRCRGGCDNPCCAPAPSCGDCGTGCGCGRQRPGLLTSLRNRNRCGGCCEPTPVCAPAPRCGGCASRGGLLKRRCGCGSVDCGGCCESAPSCGCDTGCGSRGGLLKRRGRCCESTPVCRTAPSCGGCDSGCCGRTGLLNRDRGGCDCGCGARRPCLISRLRGRMCDRACKRCDRCGCDSCDSGCGQEPCGCGCNSVIQGQPVPQAQPDPGYDSMPVEGSVAPEPDASQPSPLDGAGRNPIVDPSAFIIRGTGRLANTN